MSWIKRVEAVLNVLKDSSIGEIELAEGGFEIILRRSPGTIVAMKPRHHEAIHQTHSQNQATDNHTITINAPLTGVYYASPTPNAEPFIKVGDTVTRGQTIALIESMKVFNEIQAETSGRVVAIKVQNGDVVKKDVAMFQVVLA